MSHCVVLALGVIAAGAGGVLFVRGVVGLGQWARISPGLVGATIAALATSSPEWSVGISSALMGAPQISLGDTLGSNISNGLLIVGAVAVICPIRMPFRQVAIVLIFGIVSLLATVPLRKATIGPWRGLLLLALYVLYLTATLV